MKKKEVKWVSDVITNDVMDSWDSGSIVTVSAPTGSGKSHFIKNDLYEKAKLENKKVLFLIHRSNCYNQFLMELEREGKLKDGVLTLATYQSIEYRVAKKLTYKLSDYDYIVSDEFHYFMADSLFNRYSDLSLKAILNKKDATRIFMSATDMAMRNFLVGENSVLKLEGHHYRIPRNYDFIDNLCFYYKDNILLNTLQDMYKNKVKTIVFFSSAEKALEFYKEFEDVSIFNCGKSHRNYRHVNQKQIKDLLDMEGFDKVNEYGEKDSTKDKLFLFTTQTFDAGINIKMRELRNIFIDGIFDDETVIQCVGRKRILGKDDKLNIFVRAFSSVRLGGLYTETKTILDLAEDFKALGDSGFSEKHYRLFSSGILYDEPSGDGLNTHKKLNLLTYHKYLNRLNTLNEILSEKYKSKDRYAQYFSKVLHQSKYDILEDEEDKKSIELYLERNIGKIMSTVSDRKELIEKLNVRSGKNNKLLRSIDVLNSSISEMKLNYKIEQFRYTDTTGEKKKEYKAAWRILEK